MGVLGVLLSGVHILFYFILAEMLPTRLGVLLGDAQRCGNQHLYTKDTIVLYPQIAVDRRAKGVEKYHPLDYPNKHHPPRLTHQPLPSGK